VITQRSFVEHILLRAYEFALLLSFVVLGWAPIHQSRTHHYPIESVGDHAQMRISVDDGLGIGSQVDVFRFNPGWKTKIGIATVSDITSHSGVRIAQLTFDPKTFAWPMGRQGRIHWLADSVTNDRLAIIHMGPNHGFHVGDRLNLFQGANAIGWAIVQRTDPEELLAQVFDADLHTLDDVIVSEFSFPTSAVVFEGGAWSILEILILALTLGYWLRAIYTKQYVFSVFGSLWQHLQVPLQHFLQALAAFIRDCLFLWLALSLIVASLGYLFPRLDIPASNLQGNFVLLLIAIAISVGVRRVIDKTVWMLLWELTGFKIRGALVFQLGRTVGLNQNVLNWVLHAVIVYVFAGTLLGFLSGNIRAITELLGPTAQGSTKEIFFNVARYSLWCATIVGCLVGYGYSVVMSLFKSHIRHIDFTLMGWVSNALCYGPLLGFLLWRIAPSFTGKTPVLSDSVWNTTLLTLELFLNLLYTLSIWNMGTKFGVMTSKGLVQNGFYRVVRHPSYTLEVLMLLCMELNGISSWRNIWGALVIIVFPYIFRAEREDQFMGVSDPGYKSYSSRVPDKYIPGLK
jgi:protein-S-isoprenylcysteine O-methyltransferase Ste14